jgi:hypothetical protein
MVPSTPGGRSAETEVPSMADFRGPGYTRRTIGT